GPDRCGQRRGADALLAAEHVGEREAAAGLRGRRRLTDQALVDLGDAGEHGIDAHCPGSSAARGDPSTRPVTETTGGGLSAAPVSDPSPEGEAPSGARSILAQPSRRSTLCGDWFAW